MSERKSRAPLRATLAAVGALALAPAVAQADTFALRIGSGHPSGPSAYVTLIEKFFVPEVTRRVAEETEHTVEFIEGYGGSIAGVADTLEAVQNGLLDIGGYCMCFEPSKLFLHNFPYYVAFGPQKTAEAMKAVRATYDAVPWLTEAFGDYDQSLLGLSAWDNYHLGTVMSWDSVEDLEGVKISGAGPNLPWLEYAGAVPVTTTLPDAYMGMQTGVFDGILMLPSAYLGFKFYEPAPYFTLVGFGAMPVNVLTMNNNSLARLPEDVAKIIREVGREYEARSGEELDKRQASGLAGLEKNGAIIRDLPADVRAAWARQLVPFAQAQADEADSRGLPGTEVISTYVKKVSESGYKWLTPYDIK
jgi:TRAP-type C4-dicarboxylate transport system substrate-binding protein